MDAVTQVVAWLNAAADAVGRWILAPIGMAPAWLSTTVVAAATGVLMLLAFKYTSNQRAIKRVRDDISANLLALKLFKDSASAALNAQRRLLLAAGRLLFHALVPMAVLFVPVTLFLGQLSLWYETQPLPVGEDAVVTMRLTGEPDAPFPEAMLQTPKGVEATAGPFHLHDPGRREICWRVRATEAGYHRLAFQVGGQKADKELAAGDGFMRVSTLRPGWSLTDVLTHPSEPPFGRDSTVQSIEIQYEGRDSLSGPAESWPTYWFTWSMTGAGWLGGLIGLPAWMIYWFVASILLGLCCSRILKVNV